ncbi:MAG TPA: hypothetical protein ENF44_06555 [Deltaproteobacteria bacterium]|nr:hypothetical protein [Deltaproteobacteria bacterium]
MDRWILHRFQQLVARVREAYDSFTFHTIYHAVHNFCVVDLSSLYLDILKERLYVSAPSSPRRRSSQTAIYRILKGMIRLMAPILSFTAEEAWGYLPKEEGDPDSVHLTTFPEVEEEMLDEDLAERWEQLLEVREVVTKALEEARQRKEIGHSLDARLTLRAPSELAAFLRSFGDELREIFIVSQLEIGEAPGGLQVEVSKARGKKCARCWVYHEEVGHLEGYPDLCPRCVEVISQGR